MRDGVALSFVAFGCAVFLLLGIVAPRELARTTWEHRGGTRINDSPAGYVGLVSLCGVAALAALAVGARWPRTAVAAALAAAAAFAYGAYVVGSYWLGLARGVVGLEGRADSTMRPPQYIVHWPFLLPVFAAAALVGFVCAIALALLWRQRTLGDKDP